MLDRLQRGESAEGVASDGDAGQVEVVYQWAFRSAIEDFELIQDEAQVAESNSDGAREGLIVGAWNLREMTAENGFGNAPVGKGDRSGFVSVVERHHDISAAREILKEIGVVGKRSGETVSEYDDRVGAVGDVSIGTAV